MATNVRTNQAFPSLAVSSLVDALVTSTRFVLRALYFVLLVVTYFATTVTICLVTRGDTRQRALMRVAQLYSQLWVLGFNIQVDRSVQGVEHGTFLVVSNHMSYLDIPIIASMIPCLFVTSVEIKHTPFLGHICKMAACFFVERRNRSRINEEIEQMRTALRKGFNIGIFPEGTSTNGERILPFKKSLLQSAVDSGARVLPVCLNYTHINGQPVDRSTRDLICWYDKMGFLPHFFRFLCLKSIRAELVVTDSFAPGPGDDRSYIADRSRQQIVENFLPVG